MTFKDDESDIQSTLSDAPPDWNSDDEPPEDHVGDENTCSRDGAVRKVIQKVGKGLERPGQNDIVTLRFSTIQLDGSDNPPGSGSTESPEDDVVTVEMGDNHLPLAVEFAVKHMRVGEVAEVRAPAVYSAVTSPLCGRSLRTQPGVLPKTDKVKRRHRFLPAAPRAISEQAKKDLLNFRKAKQEATDKGETLAATSPPMFRARVELLGMVCILALTEDRSVTKRILQVGSSRRQPRKGDVVTFSYCLEGERDRSETCTLTLGEDKLPFSGLYHVLLSMKEEERCLARLSSAAALPEDSGEADPPQRSLEVSLLRWRRRDLLPVGPEVEASAQNGGAASCMLKTEIHQGPERRSHDIEAGSMVLAALAAGGGKASLLSWRMGEGAVPGYLDVAAASMRFCESAAFEASKSVQSCRPTGPSYQGQTPLRKLLVDELEPWLSDLLNVEAEVVLARGDVNEESPKEGAPHLLPIPSDWMMQGEVISWSDVSLPDDGRFKLVLLAATEAVDLCLLEEEGQLHFLELERAHGNALAKVGRFEEASEAYRRALDAVRRSPLYKALFPTERGHIQGAYIREACEGEHPLQKMSEEEASTRRGQLVALHLNLSLCATKAGLFALARRHAETALGAEPENAKALFRRGQAAAGQGDYEDALKDLQRAAELMPQDRGIRSEIQAVQRDLRAHREAQKNMFVNVFDPGSRKVQGEQ
ncbi:N-terminally processed] [Durusdinium trenchii]|uniref:peptidylprolyl isomerase n=1 Tax=Durusdinium trenchii TaxID=1381693 RepID=A0ABP0R9S7_9DINO